MHRDEEGNKVTTFAPYTEARVALDKVLQETEPALEHIRAAQQRLETYEQDLVHFGPTNEQFTRDEIRKTLDRIFEDLSWLNSTLNARIDEHKETHGA